MHLGRRRLRRATLESEYCQENFGVYRDIRTSSIFWSSHICHQGYLKDRKVCPFHDYARTHAVLIGRTISCAVIFLNELYQSFNVSKT